MNRAWIAAVVTLIWASGLAAQEPVKPQVVGEFDHRGEHFSIISTPAQTKVITAPVKEAILPQKPVVPPQIVARKRRGHGLKPTSHFDLVRAKKFVKPLKAAPASFGVVPSQLSYWGNDVDGDCVSASIAFRIAAYSLQQGYMETFVPSATLTAWASQYGYLQGATITGPMQTIETNGLVASDGKTYTGGPYSSVDYTDYSTLCAAIAQGPVMIGVDGDPLENVVGTTNGWYAAGISGSNEDHCITACGYGTAAQCYQFLAMTPPTNATSATCLLIFTWDTVGVMDFSTGLNTIAGEAWVSEPTTMQQATPNPSPSPSPTPTPSPSPTPTPTPTPSPSPTPSPTTTTVTLSVGEKLIIVLPNGSRIVIDQPTHEISYPGEWKAIPQGKPHASGDTYIQAGVLMVQGITTLPRLAPSAVSARVEPLVFPSGQR